MNHSLNSNLDDPFFQSFRNWLKLDLDSVTWQGRYQKEFEDFWHLFFKDLNKSSDVSKRFDYALSNVSTGPIRSWFIWLREKFISYLFLTKEMSIGELSDEMSIPLGQVASILRAFFIDQYPHLFDQVNEIFQVVNYSTDGRSLTYKDFKSKIDSFSPKAAGEDFSDDVIASLEVTLYKEWQNFLKQMRKTQYKVTRGVHRERNKKGFKGQWKIVRDVIILVLLGLILVFGIKSFNLWYGTYLVGKISIYDPQLKWLDTSLTFKHAGSDVGSFELNPDEMAEITDEVSFPVDEAIAFRYDTESEVGLASWDTLPRDFSVVDMERSDFEELQTEGYRDTRFGNRVVYRVMMNSVNTYQTRERLNHIVDLYNISQVDHVRPGQFVPGGVYYNLFVSQEKLKEFLAKVMDVDDAVLYESRTRQRIRGPAGHNKVFIWVKSI